MTSIFDYLVKPKGERYNNSIDLGEGKELILNTEISNHQFINRVGIVLKTPLHGKTDIQPGDEVTLHHNVFRRWYDAKGREKNSRAFISEDAYLAQPDQVFLTRRQGEEWRALEGFTFVQPLINDNRFDFSAEKECVGVVKYSDGVFNVGDIVGYTPSSSFEFIVGEDRLYRVMNKFITINYGIQRNERTYNPGWAKSS